jgi:hypothetical protein
VIKEVASDVVSGLRSSPGLLAIVVLNAIAIGVGVWFLRGVVDDARTGREQLMGMVERMVDSCIGSKPDGKSFDRHNQ